MGMIVLNKTRKKTVCFDVDNTLIMWIKPGETVPEGAKTVTLYDELAPEGRTFYPHTKHIERIKDLKNKSQLVVVWSATGVNWAEKIVRLLGLEEYVDLVMSKPDQLYDDISDVREFIPVPQYKKFEMEYGVYVKPNSSNTDSEINTISIEEYQNKWKEVRERIEAHEG